MKPFTNKESQKHFSTITIVLGLVIMITDVSLGPVTTYVSSFNLGVIIAGIGLVYLFGDTA